MSEISFFTPVYFDNKRKSASEAIFEAVDGYLSFGRKQACVIATPIDGEKGVAVLSERAYSPVLHTLTAVSFFALSYLTIIIPIIALALKAGFRSHYQFTLIDPKTLDPKAELEKGISPELQGQIQRLMPFIQKKQNHPEIEWITKKNTQSFRLRQAPQFIIKMNVRNPSAIEQQFQNRLEGKRICMMYQLTQVTIPQTRLIEGAHPFMIEQSLPIQPATSHPKTIRQMTNFILKTGFHPTHLEREEKALKSLVDTLFSEEQIDIVLSEVKRHSDMIPKWLQDAKINRLKAIAFEQQFQTVSREFGFVGHLLRSKYSYVL